MQTALLCSYEKDAPLLKLGSALKEHGWGLLGSAGTAKYLTENGIACRDVGEIVGAPILGHRVVTLAREIYAGILSRDEDAAELEAMRIPRIDLVYVTLYPLEKAIEDSASPADIIEKTDIGGPTLLRAAAKGRRIVLSDPAQIDTIVPLLGAPIDERTLEKLGAAAERRVSEYADAAASYWEQKSA